MQVKNNDTENKDNIKVVIRVRPRTNLEMRQKQSPIETTPSSITITTTKEKRNYTFDYVANEDSTQSEIFEQTAKDVCNKVLMGYNGTIFVYGQTGAGKTYTLLGPKYFQHNYNFMDLNKNFKQEDYNSIINRGFINCRNRYEEEGKGILPRTIEYIFERTSKECALLSNITQENAYSFSCSFLELYNEQISDLFDFNSNKQIYIRENKDSVVIENLLKKEVKSPEEALDLVMSANQNRHTASTKMNAESSRSHAVFSLYITHKIKKNSKISFKNSVFHLIDLAGSERQKNTECVGQRIKEAGKINKSLMQLSFVIKNLSEAISKNKQVHIHYRDSKLTHLLKDSLGGNSKTCIICNISPSYDCIQESISTLNFAQSAKLIKNKAVINEINENNMNKNNLEEYNKLKIKYENVKEENALLMSLLKDKNYISSNVSAEHQTPNIINQNFYTTHININNSSIYTNNSQSKHNNKMNIIQNENEVNQVSQFNIFSTQKENLINENKIFNSNNLKKIININKNISHKKDLFKTIDCVEQDIDNLIEEINTKEKTIKNLYNSINTLTSKISKYEIDLQTKQNDIMLKKKEYISIKKDYDESISLIKTVITKNACETREVLKCEKKLECLTMGFEQEKNILNQEIQKNLNLIKSKNNIIESTNKDLKEYSNMAEKKEEVLYSKKENYNTKNEIKKKKKEEIEKLELDYIQIQKEKNQYESELKDIQQKYYITLNLLKETKNECKDILLTCKSKLADLNSKKLDLENTKENKNDYIKSEMMELQNINNDICQNEQKIFEIIQYDLSSLNNILKQKQEQYNNLNNELINTNTQIDKYNFELNCLTENNNNLCNKIPLITKIQCENDKIKQKLNQFKNYFDIIKKVLMPIEKNNIDINCLYHNKINTINNNNTLVQQTNNYLSTILNNNNDNKKLSFLSFNSDDNNSFSFENNINDNDLLLHNINQLIFENESSHQEIKEIKKDISHKNRLCIYLNREQSNNDIDSIINNNISELFLMADKDFINLAKKDNWTVYKQKKKGFIDEYTKTKLNFDNIFKE